MGREKSKEPIDLHFPTAAHVNRFRFFPFFFWFFSFFFFLLDVVASLSVGDETDDPSGSCSVLLFCFLFWNLPNSSSDCPFSFLLVFVSFLWFFFVVHGTSFSHFLQPFSPTRTGSRSERRRNERNGTKKETTKREKSMRKRKREREGQGRVSDRWDSMTLSLSLSLSLFRTRAPFPVPLKGNRPDVNWVNAARNPVTPNLTDSFQRKKDSR